MQRKRKHDVSSFVFGSQVQNVLKRKVTLPLAILHDPLELLRLQMEKQIVKICKSETNEILYCSLTLGKSSKAGLFVGRLKTNSHELTLCKHLHWLHRIKMC